MQQKLPFRGVFVDFYLRAREDGGPPAGGLAAIQDDARGFTVGRGRECHRNLGPACRSVSVGRRNFCASDEECFRCVNRRRRLALRNSSARLRRGFGGEGGFGGRGGGGGVLGGHKTGC